MAPADPGGGQILALQFEAFFQPVHRPRPAADLYKYGMHEQHSPATRTAQAAPRTRASMRADADDVQPASPSPQRAPERPYGVPRGIRTPVTAVKGRCPGPLDDGDAVTFAGRQIWWSQSGSNRRPLQCHCSALPAELWPRERRGRVEQCRWFVNARDLAAVVSRGFVRLVQATYPAKVRRWTLLRLRFDPQSRNAIRCALSRPDSRRPLQGATVAGREPGRGQTRLHSPPDPSVVQSFRVVTAITKLL